MTYVSHTVRSLRRDPIPDEEIRLVVTVADDASGEEVAEEIEALGGEVVRELEFDRLLVAVEQTDIEAVCSLDSLSVVETDAVLDKV